MHTFSESGAGVPAFLAKLWRLVEDPETNNLISWSKDGRSFIIQNQAQFARELLPMNYKHNNMASFIRQLNMYGFHKITSLENGGLKFDRDEMEFSHPCFKRGHPYLLEHIKRKIATSKSTSLDEKGLIKPEAINSVLNEVKAVRGRQDTLDSRFSVMKQENEALWREIASLRQKHLKQQQIVNKLIQFLVTIVQPQRKMAGPKRQYQLMINDVPFKRKKSESDSGSGPVIRELTEELLDEVVDADDDEFMVSSPNVLSPGGAGVGGGGGGGGTSSDLLSAPSPDGASSVSSMDRPKSNPSISSSLSSQNYDQQLSNQSVEDATNPSMSILSHNVVGPDDVVYHVSEAKDNMDMDATDFIEENVLNTPLVKEEMARIQKEQRMRQLRKQQRKRLIQQQATASVSGRQKKTTASSSTVGSNNSYSGNSASFQTAATSLGNLNDLTRPLEIKTEKDLDNLLFLDSSDDISSSDTSPIDSMISPLNVGGVMQNQKLSLAPQDDARASVSPAASTSSNNIYANDDFILGETGDMTSDLFENSPMLGDINLAAGSFNQNVNLKGISGGKSGVATMIFPQNMKSTSSTSKVTATATSTTPIASTSKASTISSGNGSNDGVVAVAGPSDSQEQNMTLTNEDFTNHLDNIQDDLDNLKDVLRGDGYSFDANTLLSNSSPANNRFVLDGEFFSKLFSDSDVLAPYGLSISTENDKKGTEVMQYQPYYADLSDILDINSDPAAKSPVGYEDNATNTAMQSNSVLNTPYHE